MKLTLASLLFLLYTASASVAAKQQQECCLCDSCAAVPPAKQDMILLHDDEDLGETCAELALTLLMSADDSAVCSTVQEVYQDACCTEGFETMELMDEEMMEMMMVEMEEEEVPEEKEEQITSSFLRGARDLLSWSYSSSSWGSFGSYSSSSTSGSYSSSNTSSTSRTSSRRSFTWESEWSSSSRQSSSGGSSTSSSSTSSSSSSSSTSSSSTSSSSSYSSSTSTSVAVDCTREPVGVPFSTPGGNFGFGVCRDGSEPSAAAQGATVWDPNERRAFQGNCQYVDSMARQGYMANNMCAITRIRLDGPCCSAPTHTSSSLEQTWTYCRGNC